MKNKIEKESQRITRRLLPLILGIWMGLFLSCPAEVTLEDLPKMQLHMISAGPLYSDGIRDSYFSIFSETTAMSPSDIDPNGWFIRLPTPTDDIWYRLADSDVLYGVYVVTWEGEGSVTLDCPGHVQTLLLDDRVNKRIVAINPQGVEIRVVVKNINPTNHIKNIHCWRPDAIGSGTNLTQSSTLSVGNVEGSLEPAAGESAPLFHPLRLQMLGEGTPESIRFMGTLKNISGTVRYEKVPWSERTSPNYATQTAGFISGGGDRVALTERGYQVKLGICYEDLIELCNQLQMDFWVEVPHDASDAFIQSLATLIAARLDPTLRVWFELSNEMWNSAEAYRMQYDYSRQHYADVFGVPVSTVASHSPEHAWGVGDLVGNAIKQFKLQWTAEGMDIDRCIGVAPGWQNGAAYNRGIYDRAEAVSPGCVDVFAISTYFGNSLASELVLLDYDTSGNASEATYMDAARTIEAELMGEIQNRWLSNLALNLPVPITAYEGGQHLTATGFINANPGFHEFLFNLNKHPLMADLYQTHWHLWKSLGLGTPTLYGEMSTWSTYGYWGAKDGFGDDSSVKWQAYLDFLADQKTVNVLGYPVGSAPSFITQKLPILEQDLYQDIPIYTSGGDGAVHIEQVGGFLPEGLDVVDMADGTARLRGTPSVWGTFFLLVRGVDADGDPAYANYTIEVSLAGVEEQNLIHFVGSAVDAQYRPQRTRIYENNNLLQYYPFSMATGDAFYDEAFGDPSTPLDPLTTDLNFYGGFETVFTEIPGVPNVSTPNSTPNLEASSGFDAYHAGTQQLTSESTALFVWRKDQFNHFSTGRVKFGNQTQEATLLLDVGVKDSIETAVHFVIRNGSTWYFSEAAYTKNRSGTFSIENFSDNPTEGFRWAPFIPSSGFPLPSSPSYQKVNFNDVQAVGIHFNGKRDQYGWRIGFSRFLALGASGGSGSLTFTLTAN